MATPNQGHAFIPVYASEALAEAAIFTEESAFPKAGTSFFDLVTSSIKVSNGATWDSTTGAPVASANADAAALTAATLTDSSGGSATQTLALVTNIALLTDSSTGTPADTIVPVTAVNGSGATTAQEGVIDDNFASITEELIAQRAANTALIDAVASMADEINALLVDITDLRTQFNAGQASFRTSGLLAT